MIQLQKLKLVLGIALFISLVIYHLTNMLIPQENGDIQALWKIAQFTLLPVFFYIGISNTPLTKLLLQSSYIGGYYTGRSHKIQPSGEKERDEHIEVFSIVQNSFETRISGRSFKQVEGKLQLVSTWSGRSFEADDDTYSFGIQLSTSSTEYAVLKLTFSVNQTYGMYYSGLPGTSFSAGLEAEQVDKKTYSKYINDISRQTFLPTKQA